jgi:hypothetical protein
MEKISHLLRKKFIICCLPVLFAFLSPIRSYDSTSAKTVAEITVQKIRYQEWADSLVLGNGKVEAVIVPAIGRVMQFRFVGEQEGPFWENADLFGKSPDHRSKTWGNFGGDKTWPAPQSDWPKITPRSWPPPQAFDSMPVTAEIRLTPQTKMVELISAVDPHYGIRTRRLVVLDYKRPQMTITTTYEKVEGDPVTVGVWIITQLKDPQAVHILLPKNPIFAEGYTKQSKQLPAELKRQGRLLSLKRDPKVSTKIGTDASSLLWIGEKYTLRIDSPRATKETYPDQGSSAEVYTNLDPLKYVELEMLGPLKTIKVGDRIEHANTYTLSRK